MILTGELGYLRTSFLFCFSFFCFEVEEDFPLVGVVDVLVADLVRDPSALDLGGHFSDQAEPNSHQRVDVGWLEKKKKEVNVDCWLLDFC